MRPALRCPGGLGACVLAGLLGLGCLSTPTTLQTARTTEPKQLAVGAGASLPISTRFVGEVADLVDSSVETASEARSMDRSLTDEEQRDLEESAMALLLFAIFPVFELDARYGAIEGLDVGLQFSSSAVRLDGKWRFLRREGFDLAAVLGYTYHFGYAAAAAEELHELFDFAALVDYDRNDLNFSLLASGDQEAPVVPYGALHYVAAFISLESEIRGLMLETALPATETSPIMHVVAGTGGVRVGTPKLRLYFELTVGWVFLEPEVRMRTFDLSGLIITPAIGAALETG